ncbi:MAG: hypothetical protein ACT4NY_31265 [Pseudonocardiales bacterium]
MDHNRRLAVLSVTSARDGREPLMTIGSMDPVRRVAGPVEAGPPRQVAMTSQLTFAYPAFRTY